jgi:hypothetical protein
MSKFIELDGVKHEFPDDFSDTEIRSALMSHEPQNAPPPPKTVGDRLQNAWDKATPGGPLWLAKQAVEAVKGSVDSAKVANMTPQTEDEAAAVNQARDALPGYAMQAASVFAPGAPGGTGGMLAAPMLRKEPSAVAQAAPASAAQTVMPKAAAKPPTIEQLDAAATAGFEHADVKNLSIHPKALQDWATEFRSKMNEDGFDDNVAPKTFAILKRIDSAPPNSVVTGQNLQSLRRTFSRAAGTTDRTEVAAATKAIDLLDEFVEGGVSPKMVLRGDPSLAASVWADARGNYAAARRSERVGEAVEGAELQAGSSHSGQNIDNSTRAQLKGILKSEKQRRGFSGEELRQMKRVVMGTYPGDAARFIGKMFGGGGGLGTTATAAMGYSAAGGLTQGPVGLLGAAIPIVGFAFTKIGNAITNQGVTKLDALIRSRSPLATQMIRPLQKYGEAVQKLEGERSPRNRALLMIAARNLATNLKDAGIVTTAEKLIGSLQSPGEATADKDEK